MQTNLEKMTNNYNLACVEAVSDTIHKLATKWGAEEVDILNAGKYQIFIRLPAQVILGAMIYYGWDELDRAFACRIHR